MHNRFSLGQFSSTAVLVALLLGVANYLLNTGFYAAVSRLSSSPSEFGIFVSAMSLLGVLQIVAGLGMDSATYIFGDGYFARRDYAKLRGLGRSLAGWIAIVCGLLGLLALGYALLREDAVFVPRDLEVFLLACWGAAACALEFGSIAMLESCNQTVVATIIDKGLNGLLVLAVGVSVLVLFKPEQSVWAVVGVAVANLVLALIAYGWSRRILNRLEQSEIATDERRTWIATGLTQSGVFLLTMEVAPLFVLAGRVGQYDLALVGVFGALLQIAMLVKIPFSGLRYEAKHAIAQAIIQRDCRTVCATLSWIAGAAIALGFLAGGVFLWGGSWVLQLFGDSFQGANQALAILAVGMGCLQASRAVYFVPMLAGRIHTILLYSSLSVPMGLTITHWASVQGSLNGMAVGFLVFALSQLCLNSWVARKIVLGWSDRAG